ncbi:4'-phosphopantetheinyl transferase family protein [Arthrobacter antioxidans]|uniref:4'-phosphopantetheinyl transferase family protein n=1 Tax=Arthrobacter antioxidans TaxID=2895818 RepID=UPI001FFF7E26|nr:4'-phosphopantetheinyl transferase superfamily protein [Arthrobacter antioxidans]
MVDVYWAQRKDAEAGIDRILSDQERVRLNSIKCLDTALSFQMGRSMLRRTVAQRQGCHPENVPVQLSGGARGKPTLPGTGWEISLSHSGHWVGLAITKGAAIGMDIEGVDEGWDPLPIAPLVCTPHERQELWGVAAGSRARMFTRLWTRKEAVLKATGQGIRHDLNQLQVGPSCRTPVDATWTPDDRSHPIVRLVDLQDRPEALASLAALTAGAVKVTEHDGSALVRIN